MVEIKKDLAEITNISERIYDKIFNLANNLVGYAFKESLIEKSTETVIDLEIGQLIIYINNSELEYKFIPSEKLENDLVNIYNGKKDTFSLKVEEGLNNRVQKIYKDLF